MLVEGNIPDMVYRADVVATATVLRRKPIRRLAILFATSLETFLENLKLRSAYRFKSQVIFVVSPLDMFSVLSNLGGNLPELGPSRR